MRSLPILVAAFLPAVAAAQQQPVEVRFTDLTRFTDFTITHASQEREAQGLADELRVHMERRAPAFIPPGTRLEMTVRDVDMAGEFLPSRRSPHSMLRIVRGVYMPRVDLDFRLLGSDGRVLAEGRRELRDPAFLSSIRARGGDTLSFEKAMLDKWLAREFPRERSAAAR